MDGFNRIRQVAPICTQSNTCFIGHLDRFGHFVQLTAESPCILQWAAPFPLKIAPSHEGSGPLPNTRFLGITRTHNPNEISIGSAVFAGLTTVTGRPTDHVTLSVATGRTYVRSTAMRPNKTKVAF